jgi:hypothetical protein
MPGTYAGTQRFHGSSLPGLRNPLDQERAASMADEGGVSGAITDAREQAKDVELAAADATRPRYWAWALGALGAVLLAGVVYQISRS